MALKSIPAYWLDIPNFGDRLTPFILSLAGCHAARARRGRLLMAGSLARWARPGDVLLGAGSLTPGELCSGVTLLAARGPLTAPAPVYGDAGLLVGAFIKRRPNRKGVLVIPHWMTGPVATTLPVCRPCALPGEVIRRINESSLVLSESLHGCVIADALGVPNRRVRLRDGGDWELHCGDHKWDDYYLGIGSPPEPAAPLETALAEGGTAHDVGSTIDQLLTLLKNYETNR